MKIGYARVSRLDQKMELQTDALQNAGVEKIFTDKISGSKYDRPGLNELLTFVREDDCIVVWRLDRLARSMKDLIEISNTLQSKNIQLISLTEHIDTTSPTGKLFFHIFGAMAEFERNLIIERTRAGLDAAKARGMVGGRKHSLNDEKLKMVKTLVESSNDYAAIARTVKVSERTIRRVASGEYKNERNNGSRPDAQ